MRPNQEQFTKLILELNGKKEHYQELLNSTSANSLSIQLKVPVTTLRAALDALGIKHGRVLSRERKAAKEAANPPNPRLDPRITDLLTVVRRMAQELGADHKEIIKYFAE